MDAHTKGLVLGFGLVALSVILAIIAKQIQAGLSAFGHLRKTVELSVNPSKPGFLPQRFSPAPRLAGFQPVDDGVDFIQGSSDLAEFGAASHASTKKLLTLHLKDSGPDNFIASVTLRYLGLVVVDTGESAYRDAILDFVSGKTDRMVAVPTESLLALNSLVGGLIACVVAGSGGVESIALVDRHSQPWRDGIRRRPARPFLHQPETRGNHRPLESPRRHRPFTRRHLPQPLFHHRHPLRLAGVNPPLRRDNRPGRPNLAPAPGVRALQRRFSPTAN